MNTSTALADTADPADLASGVWRLDPSRSSVRFHVPNLYGLVAVKGRFDRYDGTLSLADSPAVALAIEAESLDTGNRRRDKHLRSGDFFDGANHPQVRFEGDVAELEGGRLQVRGLLHAAGRHVQLDVGASVTPVGDELEIDATARVDHRQLGMTWSPLGMVRTPSKLVVRGILVRG